jgi:3-oxoacyl-[acyl-carrier-protein] synthase III
MRWNDIYIDSMAGALGQKELASTAVAEGRYDADEHKANGYRAVRVMDEDRAAIESAVDAATLALKRSSVNHDDIVLAAHASVGYQGLEHFAPASYVQGKSLGGEAMAVEIRQFSNRAGLAPAGIRLSHGLQARRRGAAGDQ